MLIGQIDHSVVIALIGVLGGILPVGISYVLTKNKEIDANTREEKTKRYDELIGALVKIVNILTIYKSDAHHDELLNKVLNNFIAAYHRSSTYASDLVLQRCNVFVLEIVKGKEGEDVTIDELIQDKAYVNSLIDHALKVFQAIRLDINPKAKYSYVYGMSTSELYGIGEEKVSGAPKK